MIGHPADYPSQGEDAWERVNVRALLVAFVLLEVWGVNVNKYSHIRPIRPGTPPGSMIVPLYPFQPGQGSALIGVL